MALLAELMREFLPHVAGLGAPVVEKETASTAGDAVTALRNAAEVVFKPAKLSVDKLQELYHYAWSAFYQHAPHALRMSRVLKRAIRREHAWGTQHRFAVRTNEPSGSSRSSRRNPSGSVTTLRGFFVAVFCAGRTSPILAPACFNRSVIACTLSTSNSTELIPGGQIGRAHV